MQGTTAKAIEERIKKKNLGLEAKLNPLIAIVTGLIGPLDILNRIIDCFIQRGNNLDTPIATSSKKLILGNFARWGGKRFIPNSTEISASSWDNRENAKLWSSSASKEHYTLENRKKAIAILRFIICNNSIIDLKGMERIPTLTPAESVVFVYTALAYSTADTAKIMNLKPKTIEVHRNNALKKLNISKSSMTTLIAFLLGIIGPQDMLNRIIEKLVENGKQTEWNLQTAA